ncbi:MAG: hypothetical protein DMG72_16460 [Acidobacteria bacterium]|nr:MAG: hypothetical protein DMG72_16460 [Acidobacteriota bacterium]
MRAWFGFGVGVCYLIVCLTTVPCLTFGQGQTSQKSAERKMIRNVGTSPALASEILINERAVWEAAKLRDMRRFAELVADDARMVFTSGVMTKQQYMQTVGKRTINDYSLENFQVFMPAEGTVITLYQATVSGASNGKVFPATTLRESSVWIKRAGKWVAVWNQETPIY